MARKVKDVAKKENGNKREKGYFIVDDEKIMNIIDRIVKKPGIVEVNMVTCFELKITWLTSKYSKDEIESMLR